MAISPDNRWVVTGSEDNTARLWDLSAEDPAANPIVLRGHGGAVRAVAISPDSRWLVTGSWDNTARLWDLSAFQARSTARHFPTCRGQTTKPPNKIETRASELLIRPYRAVGG